MPIVRAKEAATMIATGKAKESDFEKVAEPGIYRISDAVARRTFGPASNSTYDFIGHGVRKAHFGA